LKIGIKISFSIAIIIAVFSAGLLVSIDQTREAMIKQTGENAISFSRDITDRLDQRVHDGLVSLQIIAIDSDVRQLVIDSNNKFDNMENVGSYVADKRAEWESYDGKDNPLFNEMVVNPLSQRLELFRQTFHESNGIDIFPEIFITNKYGATIAENNRLTDWDQSQRLQFQNTRDDGWHVSDLYYDSSAGVWGIEMAVAIMDGDEFAGMLKVAYNIEDIIDVFLASVESSPYETTRVALFSGDYRIIHATSGLASIGNDVSSLIELHDIENNKEGVGFGINPDNEIPTILAWATSDGFRQYPGLGWIVGLSIDENEFLAEVNVLQNILLGIMISSVIMSIIIGIAMIQGIVPPIKKVEKAANEISNENFDERVEIKNKDEIGNLATSVNEMAKKLKNSRKEKEEFVAMITHDLKQPLVPIKGNCELLNNPKMGELNEMQQECIDEIASNVNRQQAMIDNLVSAQKLGAGAMKYDTKELASKDLLNNCIKVHSPIMKDKKINYFDSSTEDFRIIGDKRRILEAYTNLIQNAHDFVADNGKIEIGVTDGKKEVTFFVKDDGEGIPKEKQKKLFKKYGQVESSATRKYGGTGLGLVVSQQLVEGMGGKIWLESEEGKGTTFFFTIPKASKKE